MKIKVDTSVAVPVNIVPLTDDTDFKTRETGVTFDQAGMDLSWNFKTPDGSVTNTPVTPGEIGDYLWASLDRGMYTIDIPASGGVSINNATEGYGWFVGSATGILPWISPVFEFVPANVVDSLVSGTDFLAVDVREKLSTLDLSDTEKISVQNITTGGIN
jgi:hypothetical protein